VKPAFGRRAMLLSALAGPWPVIAAASSPTAPAQASSAPLPDPVRPGRPMVFPRDHGAHPGSRIEWWYVTGWLLPQSLSAGAASGSAAQAMGPSAGTGAEDDARRLGFQVTFFRSATGKGDGLLSRFAPRQLLFAHAALSDLAARRHDHAQRLGRWSGQPDATLRDRAMLDDADVAVGGWQLRREPRSGATGAPVAPGTPEGHIAEAPRGAGGFGYDPVFVPDGEERTFAELAASEKHAIGHRGRAARAFVARLHEVLGAASGG